MSTTTCQNQKSCKCKIYFKVVGESGLGKSTLINSMFLTDIYADEKEPGKQELVQKQQEGVEGDSRQTLKVEAHHKVLVENGVKLSLTVRIMS